MSHRTRYVWLVSAVAALGGLLFGYDWVVIGGAKPFYEAYFQPGSEAQVGWANSCALLGCLVGSIACGALSDRLGRKRLMIASGFLFVVSSIYTGWAQQFPAFVSWRIVGGVAIGMASNLSPMYIAEISPAPWRGRLVSLNQLAIVVGILAAQIVNWSIAQTVPDGASAETIRLSWNGQLGWRWMFSAVVIPAIIFTIASYFIPESPRWLMTRGRERAARDVLTRIGGAWYAGAEMEAIERALRAEQAVGKSSWGELLRPGVRRVVLVGMALAVLQQWTGINTLFNYAAEVYQKAGYGANDIFLNITITGVINVVFTALAMLLVDRIGRRPLMLFGCVGIGVSHLLCAWAYHAQWQGTAVLLLTLSAIACYALTLAPVVWVLIAEIFPNRVRSQGVSAAVSALWIASFALTYTFPFLNAKLGTGGTFTGYGVICLLGCLLVAFFVPETKGRTLEQIGSDIAEGERA